MHTCFRSSSHGQLKRSRRGLPRQVATNWLAELNCRTVRQSLRAKSRLLASTLIEPLESAEPCEGLAATQLGEQLGVYRHATPHLDEEDGDE